MLTYNQKALNSGMVYSLKKKTWDDFHLKAQKSCSPMLSNQNQIDNLLEIFSTYKSNVIIQYKQIRKKYYIKKLIIQTTIEYIENVSQKIKISNSQKNHLHEYFIWTKKGVSKFSVNNN